MIPTDQKRVDKGMYWKRAWSLVEGCTPVSPGCVNCWSMDATHTRAGQTNPKIKTRYKGLTTDTGKWTGEIRLMEDSLSLPLSVKKPTTWAVWNDLFHEDVPMEFIGRALNVMGAADHHTFLVLTKRPERAGEILSYYYREFNGDEPYPNVALGTTAENQEAADARIPYLLRTPAAWRWLSLEPVLELIKLWPWLPINSGPMPDGEPEDYPAFEDIVWQREYTRPDLEDNIHWLTIGAETGRNRRPCDMAWIESLVAQADAAGVPVFVKALDLNGRVSKDMLEWPGHLRRREFPEWKSE